MGKPNLIITNLLKKKIQSTKKKYTPIKLAIEISLYMPGGVLFERLLQ